MVSENEFLDLNCIRAQPVEISPQAIEVVSVNQVINRDEVLAQLAKIRVQIEEMRNEIQLTNFSLLDCDCYCMGLFDPAFCLAWLCLGYCCFCCKMCCKNS